MRRFRWWWACVLLDWASRTLTDPAYGSLDRYADEVEAVRRGVERLRREFPNEAEELRRPGWNEAKEKASELRPRR